MIKGEVLRPIPGTGYSVGESASFTPERAEKYSEYLENPEYFLIEEGPDETEDPNKTDDVDATEGTDETEDPNKTDEVDATEDTDDVDATEVKKVTPSKPKKKTV